jgi:hypothetical protein
VWLEELSRDEPDPSNPVHDTSPPNHVMLLQENGVFKKNHNKLKIAIHFRVMKNSIKYMPFRF